MLGYPVDVKSHCFDHAPPFLELAPFDQTTSHSQLCCVPPLRGKPVQLTATCVSKLLEHLLESDELLVYHRDNNGNNNLPKAKPCKPLHHHLTNGSPATTGAPFITRSDPEAEAVEVMTMDNLPDIERPQAPSCPPDSAAQCTAQKSACASSHRVPAVIFVGFGTGANSLLHLVSGPLRARPPPPKHEHSIGRGGRGGGGDGGEDGDGRDLPDGHDAGGNEQEKGSDNRGGAEASCGRLASVLHSKGFRVGGLILANGFVALNGQSVQVMEQRDQLQYRSLIRVHFFNHSCSVYDMNLECKRFHSRC